MDIINILKIYIINILYYYINKYIIYNKYIIDDSQ